MTKIMRTTEGRGGRGGKRARGKGRARAWLALVCVVAVAVAAFMHVNVLAASGGTQQYIGEAAAKSAALKDAGVTEAQATFLKVHLDYDDRHVVYDVEFYSGNTEYDYEIDAVDGSIRESDMDIEYYSIPNRNSTTTNAGDYIGDTAAKAAALKHAGVTEAQATFIKAYLDYEDGRVVYDVEFYSGNTEYDYEIDAVSGAVVSFDKEIEYYSIPRNSTGSTGGSTTAADAGNYIGDARAKAAAFTHAGVTESQATLVYVHLDRDDGRVDYDVEFYVGNTEYEYEIDAVSGEVLEFDRETKHTGRTGAASTGSNGASTVASQAAAAAANSGSYIGEAKAKSVALSDAGLTESQVRRMKVELDRDHGQMVYEVEFENGRMEYEYEIDAVSGAILESDAEYDD